MDCRTDSLEDYGREKAGSYPVANLLFSSSHCLEAGGRSPMESYEEFCSRSLSRLRIEAKSQVCHESASQQMVLCSSIQFHGMAVLSPLLSEERRVEMQQYRQRAVQLESDRQSLHRASLLARVQDILDRVQACKSSGELQMVVQPASCTWTLDSQNGFASPPDMRNLSRNGRDDGTAGAAARGEALTVKTPIWLNGTKGGTGEMGEEDKEESDEQSSSLQGLLRQSQEQVRVESHVGCESIPTPGSSGDTLPKENNAGSAGGNSGTAHSPFSSTQVKPNSSLTHTLLSSTQLQTRSGPAHAPPSPVQLLSSSSPNHSPISSNQLQPSSGPAHNSLSLAQVLPRTSLTQRPLSPAQLLLSSSPTHSSLSPAQLLPSSSPTHCPLSPTHLLTSSVPDSFMDSFLDCTPRSLTGSYTQLPSPEPSLSPRPHHCRPRPISAGNILISYPMSATELSPQKALEGHPLAAWEANVSAASTDRSPVDPPSSSPLSTGGGWPCSHSCLSPVHGTRSPSMSSPLWQDSATPSFRRRSQTLDSHLCFPQLGPTVDQERVPRFMCGQPKLALSRRSPPAPLNQSYDVESPSPVLRRPHVDSEPTARDSQGGTGHMGPLGTAGEAQDLIAGDVRQEARALEELRLRLREEHAQQLSVLIAEQEWEQQCLQQQLGEGRSLKDWSSELTQPDSVVLQKTALSPLTLLDGSPGSSNHSMGYPSLFNSSDLASLAVQTPVYLRGLSCVARKPTGGHSQVASPEQQRTLCLLGAVARGFLTRRLLNTEKLKHLRQTVKDTQEFIRSFQKDAPAKRGALSAQDVTLQERVRAQLHAALFNVHNIFFVMPLTDRLALLRQDRELRRERKLRELEKARSPRDRVALSTATQKSMDRKKQRVSDISGQGRRTRDKPKSPISKRSSPRILKPSQGQNTPRSTQLLRQGSLCRKKPEEHVKRYDGLRKQHSLG